MILKGKRIISCVDKEWLQWCRAIATTSFFYANDNMEISSFFDIIIHSSTKVDFLCGLIGTVISIWILAQYIKITKYISLFVYKYSDVIYLIIYTFLPFKHFFTHSTCILYILFHPLSRWLNSIQRLLFEIYNNDKKHLHYLLCPL